MCTYKWTLYARKNERKVTLFPQDLGLVSHVATRRALVAPGISELLFGPFSPSERTRVRTTWNACSRFQDEEPQARGIVVK